MAEELLKSSENGGPGLSKEHINTVDEDGKTALICAISSKMTTIALELIARGAKCDVITNKKWTPLSLF